ncbi:MULTISPECIES: hypothetical protein [Pseudomonas syringae group]|uniref:CobQ/CobB/MinD/ParA nucleotide binding domain-containing protein n=2 Tax=Pseudomonas syringae group TaxID=136849 RepID=A0A0P9NM71_PSESX|nr:MULTISPECIES: hypothetical protein [Pseudomonas syringae group]KPW98507.1 Uncharacterized protein ALO79_01941 [Pseudomonas syringae pv. castaneae]KWS93169.1 hypothetical protein AL048_26270 [Pseudomonas syringae pv. castaneae]RMS92119.1 hypothetical protein ALP58_01138 [Pseudomonas savastanoi]
MNNVKGLHGAKVISGCARFVPGHALEHSIVCRKPKLLRAGDLVLCQSQETNGVYQHVENFQGHPVRIFERDYFVGVIANRYSGTNVNGCVPEGEIGENSVLYLLAQGGIIGDVISYDTVEALPMRLRVVGTLAAPTIFSTINVAEYQHLAPVINFDFSTLSKKVILVCGTSAESGKTTFVSNINLVAKKASTEIKTAAIKVCGTGRMKDYLNFADANYDVVLDFVHCGLPTTYGVEKDVICSSFVTLLHAAAQSADLIVIEIGGDLLEAGADLILPLITKINGLSIVLLVNDAMGAQEGVRILTSLSKAPDVIASYRQNLSALSARLDLADAKIMHPMDLDNIKGFLQAL